MGPDGYVLIKTLVALDSLGRSANLDFQLSKHLTPIILKAFKEDFPELPAELTDAWRKAQEDPKSTPDPEEARS